MTKIAFSRPITSFAEEVHEVELREPTAAEVRRTGLPFLPLPNGTIDFDMERVAQYAAMLSTPPLTPSAIDKLRASDLIKLAAGLAPFFADSSDPPTS